MTLTEEQRGALTRAIDYINETDLPVGELDGFDREVLRNMVTTAINYGPDVMKMIELLAAGEHDQWADWAQSILDSEPGLSDGRKAAWPEMIATPYENLSEELKDKDRREVHLRSSVALDYIQQQSAEIERLRASLIDLHAEYINTLEKNPECSAWDLDEQSDADQRRLRRNAAHAISIVEPPIYLKAEQQLAKIKELETAYLKAQNSNLLRKQEIERLRGFETAARDLSNDLTRVAKERDELQEANTNFAFQASDQAQEIERLRAENAWLKSDREFQSEEQSARIKELEDVLVNERAWRICHIPQDRVGHWPRYEPMLQDEARQQLQAEGKIGPDAAKPQSWQITEERKAAIWHAVAVLKENDPDDEHLWDEEIAVLRTMLTEAA